MLLLYIVFVAGELLFLFILIGRIEFQLFFGGAYTQWGGMVSNAAFSWGFEASKGIGAEEASSGRDLSQLGARCFYAPGFCSPLLFNLFQRLVYGFLSFFQIGKEGEDVFLFLPYCSTVACAF